MKKFHKSLALMLVLMMAFALAACNGGKAPTAEPETSPAGGTNTADPEKKMIVGFVQVGAESAWRNANTKSMQAEAEAAGITLNFVDAQQKQENQIFAVRAFIEQKVDVIVIAPTIETGWETVLQEAKDAGIPVVIADRKVDCDPDLYDVWIGANFMAEGRNAGKWLAKYLAAQGRGGQEINIAILQGTVDSSAQVGRSDGFAEIAARHDNWRIVEDQTGDFTRIQGAEVMESFMQGANADKINVLIAQNDEMAIGAISVIENAGKVPGKDIIIVTFDGSKEAFGWMVGGQINCIVECNPVFGDQVMDICKKLVAGEKVAKEVYVIEGIYDEKDAAAEIENRPF